MKLRGGSYFFILIIIVMAVIIISSARMKYIESKLLPLPIAAIILILAAVGLWREIAPGKEQKAATKGAASKKELTTETWGGYLLNGAWIVSFLLGIYVLGFIIAIALFILSYMKWLGTSWRTSIISAIVTPALVYFIFERGLLIDMYKGLLITWLGY